MNRNTKICLNGWWDFLPVLEAEMGHVPAPDTVPAGGWIPDAYLVPSSWVRPETLIAPDKQTAWTRLENSNNFDYPPEWSRTRTAWARRNITVAPTGPDRVLKLVFDAAMPQCTVYVNGRKVITNDDRTMRFEADITHIAREGENEVAVYITDNPKTESGKYTVFEGGFQTQQHCGIWQDVWLESHPAVSISDITIVTSVERNTISVECEIENRTDAAVERVAEFTVLDGAKQCLSFRTESVRVPAKGTARYISTQKWETYTPWSPSTPHLYILKAALDTPGGDTVTERFGFREFTIRGKDFVLNGTPIRMYGDWGHKNNFDNMRPEYIRQWFRMLKDANMNYVRFHTYPHPEVVLDIADEIGILVSHESAWHFGGGTALQEPALWNHAAEHVRKIVRSRKNHPCIVLWSVGNETRFSGDLSGTVQLGPILRGMYKELDPTRPVYHDGDSSLWEERTQEIISRHYGVECTGEEWWDKSRPLHVGESSRHHYGQPAENLIFGTDEMYASYSKCSEAISREAADIIEQARANGVGCICPWNLMCLDNYRPTDRELRREWPDFGAPGIKPLRSAPFGPEFNWYEPDGKGYVPGAGFDIIAHAYRKIAVIVRERLSGAYGGSSVRHTVTLVNDSGAAIRGATLRITLDPDAGSGGEEVAAMSVNVEAGGAKRLDFNVKLPKVRSARDVSIVTALSFGKSPLDVLTRQITVSPRTAAKQVRLTKRLYVMGEGNLAPYFNEMNLSHEYVASAASLTGKPAGILILERGAVREGEPLNREVDALLADGWRVLVMEQQASLFPALRLDILPVERFHIRARRSGIWDGIGENETGYWGNSPYGKKSSDAWVAEYLYYKPAAGNVSILADAGSGDFGVGGLKWTPLFETESGAGLLAASQLLLTDRLGKVPAADKLFLNLLRRLDAYAPAARMGITYANDADDTVRGALKATVGEPAGGAHGNLMILNASGPISAEAETAAKSHAGNGGTVLVWGTCEESLASVSRITGRKLKLSDTIRDAYSLVRAPEADRAQMLDGISLFELFWMERIMYASLRFENRVFAPVLFDPKGTDAQVLLTTERESCWKEFFVDGGCAELYRMPTVTMLLQGGPRAYGVGLAEIEAKAGRFILCQFRLPVEGYEKSAALWTYFLNALGVTLPDVLLKGEATAGGLKISDGRPGRVRFIADPGEAKFEKMCEMSANVEYRLPNQMLEGNFAWQAHKLEGGAANIYELTKDGAEEIVFMMQVRPGRPRKLTETEGGLPNPELQTSLWMQGAGTVRLIVHGRDFGCAELSGATGTAISAIDLDTDWNSILILYRPADKSVPFTFQWRNNKGRTETEFAFR